MRQDKDVIFNRNKFASLITVMKTRFKAMTILSKLGLTP